MATKRVEVRYRRHQILARPVGDKWEARAFRGKKPATDLVIADSSDAAVDAVKTQLDERAAREVGARAPGGYPTPAHVLAAFEQLDVSEGQLAMLDAHLEASGQILTASQLSAAAGKSGHEYANLQYGLLGRALAEEMEYTPQETRADGSTIWTYALATGVDEPGSGDLASDHEGYVEWQWRLRPEVVAALSNR